MKYVKIAVKLFISRWIDVAIAAALLILLHTIEIGENGGRCKNPLMEKGMPFFASLFEEKEFLPPPIWQDFEASHFYSRYA